MTERMPRGRERQVTDDELLRVIGELMEKGDRPVVTTPAVADETGLSQFYVRQRCESLAKNGEIERCKTGGVWIYWLD